MRKQKQSRKDQRGRGRRRKGREREGVKRWGENYPFSLPMLWKRTDELKTRAKILHFYTNFEGGMGVAKCQGHSQWAWPPTPPPAGACLRILEAHLTLAPCHGCAQRAWDPPIFAGACLEMPGGAPDLCPFHRRAQTAWYPPILLGLAWRCLEAHLTFLGKRIHLVLEILYKKAWICSSKAVQAHLSWTHHPSPAVIVLTPYCNPQVNIKY